MTGGIAVLGADARACFCCVSHSPARAHSSVTVARSCRSRRPREEEAQADQDKDGTA